MKILENFGIRFPRQAATSTKEPEEFSFLFWGIVRDGPQDTLGQFDESNLRVVVTSRTMSGNGTIPKQASFYTLPEVITLEADVSRILPNKNQYGIQVDFYNPLEEKRSVVIESATEKMTTARECVGMALDYYRRNPTEFQRLTHVSDVQAAIIEKLKPENDDGGPLIPTGPEGFYKHQPYYRPTGNEPGIRSANLQPK